MKEKELLPSIDLVGNALENFYQLGLRDKLQAQKSIDHINSLIKTSITPIDKTVEAALKEITSLLFASGNTFERYLDAYARGLDIEKKDLCHSLLIPELMGSMSKWLPSIPSALFGCTSVFYKHDSGHVSHTRLLDFPLGRSFEQGQRVVRYKLDNDFSLLTFSTAGMCFPSLTTMREDGLTLAIHQKFSDIFNTSGTPIFYLIFKLLKTCTSKEDIINFCQSEQSITSWNINISLPTGEVLEIDFLGDKVKVSQYELEKDEFLILNNELPDEAKSTALMPWGIDQYNLIRKESANSKLKALLKLKNRGPREVLKALTTIDFNKAHLDVVTSSCLGATTMCFGLDKIYAISSKAPKVYQGEMIEFSSLFSKTLKQTKLEFKPPQYPQNSFRGFSSLMDTQSAIDQFDHHGSYHHLQMAIDDLRGLPYFNVAKFYFLVLQFINDKHHKIRKELLVEFINIQKELPSYLSDHCSLFIFRLEKILGLDISIKEDAIENENLKNLLIAEIKLPNLFFHSFITKTMSIRIDLMDIIYPYASLIMIKS